MAKVTRTMRWEQAKAAAESAASRAVGLAAAGFQTDVKAELNKRRGPAPAGGPPGNVTGQLSRSVSVAGEGLTRRVGTNLVYGRWQEFGFTARPKKGKALPVPVHDKAKAALRRTGRVPKDQKLIRIDRKGGPPLLVKKVGGRNARMEVWYVLRTSVRVAARPWLRPTFARQRGAITEAIRGEFARGFAAAMARGGGKGGEK